MNRVLTTLTGLLLVLTTLGVGLWYLAFAPLEDVPDQVVLEHLEQPVRVRGLEGPAPRVQADAGADAYAGLGYVHGRRRGWTALLLRQVALGRLGRWFDPAVGIFDQWARMLGFEKTAREAYRQSSAVERRRLRAYASGIRAALEDRAGRTDELLLLRVDPVRWEPWHTLAVRNLVAWLGTPPLNLPDTTAAPPADPTAPPPSDTTAAGWLTVDRRLRSWLGLRGFDHSRAWVDLGSGPPLLMQEHVYGRSARVPFLPVVLERGDRSVELLTVPGTTLWPGGKSASRAWSVFLTSETDLERIASEAEPPALEHETVRFRDGTQEVVSFRRTHAHLRLSPRWRIAWAGFGPAGVSAGWTSLWAEASDGRSFAPFAGEGLLVDRDGMVEILGEPIEQIRWSEGRFVGGDRWAPRATERVADLVARAERPDARALFDELYSPWSDSLSRRLVRVVGSEVLQPGPIREAVTYLRNWDGSFTSASIGASILDTWLGVYRSRRGRVPEAGVGDSAETRIAWYRALEQAADSLTRRFGPDPSRWRWEAVQPNRRIFPAFSDSTYLPDRLHALVTGRYAPLDPAGYGHPSAVNWGGSSVLGPRSAPASWTSVFGGASWNRSLHRGRPPQVDRFLGRYLTVERFDRIFEVSLVEEAAEEAAPSTATRLVPDTP